MPRRPGKQQKTTPVPEADAVQTVRLPAKLNSPAAGDLARTLLALRGSPIVVDASDVAQIGAQTAQVLASAAATWASDKADFRIVKASPDFCEAMKWLGLDALFATEAGQ